MDIELTKLIVTVLLAIVGWLFAGWLSSRRDSANKRREIVVQHLIDAYKILTQEIGHRDTTVESITKFENLLSEIQLFGSREQVDIARKLSNQTAQEGVSTIDPLIENMRDALRKELGLESVEGVTIWCRFTEDFKQQIATGKK
jgi:hypothetical protein